MLKEFREFINRGNLLDLAVAFVLGLAFASVVSRSPTSCWERSATSSGATSRSINSPFIEARTP